jgi:transcriptional regulator with XRE-family HTH domain
LIGKNTLNKKKAVFDMKKSLLPQKLKELRKMHNYTQDYVAEALGIVRQTYSHYETGKRMPDAESLYKLAGLYNISVDDLMHMTLQIDRDVSYDAPKPTSSSSELSEYLEFYNIPENRKKYMFTSTLEKEFLFYFQKMSEEDKKEMIEFAKIKAHKQAAKKETEEE